MLHGEVAENVIATVATVMWSTQMVPQAWKAYKEKSVEGLSLYMMLVWAIGGGTFLGIYNCANAFPVPMQLQPHLFGLLCFVCFAQCLYYGPAKWPLRKIAILAVVVLISDIILEYLCIIGLQKAMTMDMAWPNTVMGLLPTIFIDAGFIPQYLEIYHKRMATGISFIFVLLDVGGCVLFLVTLAFREEYDWVAASNYLSVIVLDGGFVVVYYIYASWNGNSGLSREDYLIQQRQKQDAARVEVSLDDASRAPQSLNTTSIREPSSLVATSLRDPIAENGQRHRGQSQENIANPNLFSIASSTSSVEVALPDAKSTENLVQKASSGEETKKHD